MKKAYIWLSKRYRGNKASKINTFLKDIVYRITSFTKIIKSTRAKDGTYSSKTSEDARPDGKSL